MGQGQATEEEGRQEEVRKQGRPAKGGLAKEGHPRGVHFFTESWLENFGQLVEIRRRHDDRCWER